MIKISIIIPIYNSEKYLEKCLNSVMTQKMDDFEVILVNDGSKDNSQKIVDEFVKNYPDKIKSYSLKENRGQAHARNVGVSYATGEFIAFVDSDDYLEENAYEDIIKTMEEKDIDIMCFDFYEIVGNIRKEEKHYLSNDIDNVKKYIVSETSPVNKVIRRSVWTDNNIKFLENRIYEDLATIPVLAKYTSKIEFCPDRLYNYVILENSTMRKTKYTKKLEDIFYAMDKLYNDFINTEYVEELEYIYIEHLLHAATLRFLNYSEGIDNIYKISQIMKEKFPNWRKNKYYKMQSLKYKIVCNIIYLKKIRLLKKILGGK